MLYKRAIAMVCIITAAAMLLCFRVSLISANTIYPEAADGIRNRAYTTGSVTATIYDRNLKPITNAETKRVAIIVPTKETITELLPFLEEVHDFFSQLESGKPFACELNGGVFDSDCIDVFEVPIHNSPDTPAPQLIGYLSDGIGCSGLEGAYAELLASSSPCGTVSYSTDGKGNILVGADKTVTVSDEWRKGIATTIDLNIQDICEAAMQSTESGAALVMDIKNGDIMALVSRPEFDVTNVSAALTDERSPLVNRAFSAYSVGSVFKLAIAAAALENDVYCEDFTCSGSIDISGQRFRCHRASGHGALDLASAVVYSCNPYFIELASMLSGEQLYTIAHNLGFGSVSRLADGITSAAGTLPSARELRIPAEKANFAFGQGLLSATPLQVCRMTCAIANDGIAPLPRLVLGETDGISFESEEPTTSYCFSSDTAWRLRTMMKATVQENEDSLAIPVNSQASGKTSTAQTGRFDENGDELYHAWITGFFPSDKPRYAVTVLVENGGGGNKTAAPIFREIVENIVNGGY